MLKFVAGAPGLLQTGGDDWSELNIHLHSSSMVVMEAAEHKQLKCGPIIRTGPGQYKHSQD